MTENTTEKNAPVMVPVACYYPSQIALIYGITLPTWNRWRRLAKKEHLIKDRKKGAQGQSSLYSIKEVKEIFEHWGIPEVDQETIERLSAR